MNELMNIPKRINVGFQLRNDTYTGKLAYVIYWDSKGKLRKETSWENWRHKPGQKRYEYVDRERIESVYGDEVKAQVFDNVPTSGFVLNKGVGGARESYGWNPRNEYIRVYDPRNFEFEISVANLLFILQECSSIKGKGLEGEFVYAWSGKELVLLPTSSHEYKTSNNYSKLQTKKVTAKEMFEGHTYKMKDTTEVMYLGRHMWYENVYNDYGVTKRLGKKKHIFIDLKKVGQAPSDTYDDFYIVQVGFTKLASIIEDSPHVEFANEYEKLINYYRTSAAKSLRLEKVKFEISNDRYYWWKSGAMEEDSKLYEVEIQRNHDYCGNAKDNFHVKYGELYEIENGILIRRQDRPTIDNNWHRNNYHQFRTITNHATQEEVFEKYQNTIICTCENGAEYKLINN